MGPLPSSIRRRLCCCHQAGIVALDAMVSPLSMHRLLCTPGIFAVIAITLLPFARWHCCRCQAGVVALVTMASLSSSIRRCLCHHHDGIVALVALAPLPTLHRYYCPCCASILFLIALTDLTSCHMGVVTIIAPVLLPPLSWCVCAIALVSLPLSHWHCCLWCTGISTLVMQTSLPLLCLRCAVDLQPSLPLLSWHVLSRG